MVTDDVTLRSLNRDFYDGYDLFLRTDRGMMQKTVHQHTYILKKMTKRAVSQGTLRRDPYHNIHPKLPPLKSRHLKIEELERLIQCRIEPLDMQTKTGVKFVNTLARKTRQLSRFFSLNIKAKKTKNLSKFTLRNVRVFYILVFHCPTATYKVNNLLKLS